MVKGWGVGFVLIVNTFYQLHSKTLLGRTSITLQPRFVKRERTMSLPREILIERMRNEIEQCRDQLTHRIEVKDPSFVRFPITLFITLIGPPGPVMRGGKVVSRYDHRVRIDVLREYPYQKPVVRWLTEIFHPNIVPPQRGGWVCTRMLGEWSLSSDLTSLIRGLESLLLNPNPWSPYKDETTMAAARYFIKNGYETPFTGEKRHIDGCDPAALLPRIRVWKADRER